MKDTEHYLPEVQFIIIYSSFFIIHTFIGHSKESKFKRYYKKKKEHHSSTRA